MKVLGILPRDMQPRGREEYPEGMPGEIRHDAWEKKRRQLMHSVSGMAADRSLDLTKSASAVELGQPSDATNAFLADVMAREQESIVKMRTRAQADVQKIVLYEMEAKKEVEIREAKLEEHRKRMVELKKKQDEKLLAQQKEAQKKYEKSVEVRRRADLKLEQESEELWKEICVKDERVQGVLKEREEGWEQNRITKQAERRQNYDRIAIFKSGDMKVREKAWSGIVKKDKAAEERLEKVRNEMWAQQAAKTYRTDEAVKKSRDTIAAAQAGKDAAYLEREKVHAKKKEVREAIAIEQQKAYAALNKKNRQNFEKNYEKALKEREIILISPRMTKSMSENYLTKPAWKTEDSEKAFQTHHTMGELRHLNLQLLARAHAHHQRQALHKIQDVRDRVAALNASKDAAAFRRIEMVKNCAIEKHHLTFQVEKIRDAPPERMNSLLEQMGLPAIKTKAEAEAEEEEAKK